MNYKFIVVTVEPLTETSNGGVTRTKFLSLALASVGKVTVIAPKFDDSVASNVYKGSFRDLCCITKTLKKPNKVAGRFGLGPRLGVVHFEAIKEELYNAISYESPDYLVWSHSYLAAVGMLNIKKMFPEILHIVDFPNIEQSRLRSFIKHKDNLLVRLGQRLEFLKSRRWERIVARASNLNITVSQADAQFMKIEYGSVSLVAPNGLEARKFLPSQIGPPVALTVGNWQYEPNLEGIIHFLFNTWPGIVAAFPSIQLRIAGTCPPSLSSAIKASPSVLELGFVEDLGDEYEKAHFCIAPARFGAGTQIKVLEALSFSRPVIGDHYLGAQISDLDLKDCVFPTGNYVQEILYVMDNLEKITKAAYEVSLRYSWTEIFDSLKAWVRET